MTKRYNNFDLLRILAVIGVIILHSNMGYLKHYVDLIAGGQNIYSNIFVFSASFFNCIGRFAVPVFLMLSGAFLINNPKNKEYKYFYKKSFKKIFIPVIVFTILYILYSVPRYSDKMTELIKNVFCGLPYYHMWYMYMLIGVYILIPLVIRFKDDVGENTFKKVSIVFLIVSTILLCLTKINIYWNIGYSLLYLSYAMIGYVIRTSIKNKSKSKFYIFLGLGILIEIIMTVIVYRLALNGIYANDLKYSLVGSASPLSVLSAIFIFSAFSNIEIKKDFSKLSNLTFYIYLFHAVVLNIIERIINNFKPNNELLQNNPLLTISITSVSVFILSILCSKIYVKISKTKTIDEFNNKICNKIFRENERR